MRFLIKDEVANYLSERGYMCDTALTYAEGEDRIALFEYDIIILDITLPGGSGIELLKQLKKKNTNTGVIILSAKDSVSDKIAGLDLGADDYITKPFYMEELNARINSIIRRRSFEGDTVMQVDDLKIDTSAKTLHHLDVEIVLTKKEYELLLYFIVNKNRVLSKQSILAHLWGDDYNGPDSMDTIYVHTMNLRKKLVAQTGVDYIKTVYGMGYKWVQK